MRVVFWTKGSRGNACFKILKEEGFKCVAVVIHPGTEGELSQDMRQSLERQEIPLFQPENPNTDEWSSKLKGIKPDLFLLAGYGKILRTQIIQIAKKGAWNCHAGKLPEFRGSSPLNWALLRGEDTFGLSLIQIDGSIDGGDVLVERNFNITPDDNIRDLHKKANQEFPEMIREAIRALKSGTLKPKSQELLRARYFPLRFPSDGIVLWDLLTAQEIHNHIRALTHPYPGAFTFFKEKKVKLVVSKETVRPYFGEPGRVYRISKEGLLVGAKDHCLWITEACFEDTGEPLGNAIKRYDEFLTMRGFIQSHMKKAITA